MAVPLTADQLVAALRAEGCAVHEVGGWRTNNRNHKGPWGPVNGVMIHHTVTGPATDVVRLIFDGRSDLPGPLATGCITKDGTVHLVGNGRANHAGGGDPDVLAAVRDESYGGYPPPTHEHDGSPGSVDGNRHFYGFECENRGDGKDPWPPVQYAAMVRATAAICRKHGWSAKSGIGHLEWSDQKPDPRGFDMKDFRHDVAACLALPAGRWEEEDIMPQYVNLGIAEPYTLDLGAWDSIELTSEWADESGHHGTGGSVFARGPARFTGSISLALNGLSAGDCVQVRMTEFEGDDHRADHPIHEVLGTPGGTFAVVPLTKRLAAGRSMRVRLLNQSSAPITVASAVLTALVWKES
ncbi:peptidoglycan-binding protein [Streptomyces sp. AS58]|uniref:peptidoglycan recognition protein family protein n=1 Tax=Streptomyces TaxID=1883 RepID=UPI0006AE3166|nr:N-acetylmuramoyl-L-alanine amidase [Streptomyces sp. AS58]KOV74694.1 peptidoglycan-binding protein [Streptomyces sp. AS58]